MDAVRDLIIPGKRPAETSDFRLISSRVKGVLEKLPERNIILRILLPNLGFPSSRLNYTLNQRYAGTPAYTFSKSLRLATDAIFNYVNFPRGIFILGLILAAGALIYAVVIFIQRLTTDKLVPGFADIMVWQLFLGGLNIILIAILGKYLQVVLEHLKNRPQFLIDTRRSDIDNAGKEPDEKN